MRRTTYLHRIARVADHAADKLRPPHALLQRWETAKAARGTPLGEAPELSPGFGRPSESRPLAAEIPPLDPSTRGSALTPASKIAAQASAATPPGLSADPPTTRPTPRARRAQVNLPRFATDGARNETAAAGLLTPVSSTRTPDRIAARRSEPPEQISALSARSRGERGSIPSAPPPRDASVAAYAALSASPMLAARTGRDQESHVRAVASLTSDTSVVREASAPMRARAALLPEIADPPAAEPERADQSAGLKIGSIEVTIVQPPPLPPPAAVRARPAAQGAPAAPLARSFATSFGLRQS